MIVTQKRQHSNGMMKSSLLIAGVAGIVPRHGHQQAAHVLDH
jgi:hypothetical protein